MNTPSISGTVTMADGRTIQFELRPDGGYKQWGADDSRTAGETVGVVSALADGMTDMWVDLGSTAQDDDEDGCEGHESTDGPIGNVVFCDGTCKTGARR